MTDRWIKEFRKQSLPALVREFKPEKVIIFGSRVEGTATEDSDIDIIVVSSYFTNIPFLKRMSIALRRVPFPKHVDYICYTPEEYEKMKEESTTVMEALENSIELIPE